jgi:hypothetical protein
VALLRRLRALGWRERRLLAEAVLVVTVVRVGLSLCPFRLVHGAIASVLRLLHSRTTFSTSRSTSRFAPERVMWAVTAVAARVPGASCLTQALAATLLLVRYGHAGTLRVGVAKNDDGTLRAHAWLESEGRTILGEPAEGAFTPLPPLVFS